MESGARFGFLEQLRILGHLVAFSECVALFPSGSGELAMTPNSTVQRWYDGKLCWSSVERLRNVDFFSRIVMLNDLKEGIV